jgi:long-chain acyl-CoA synthetase
MVMGINAATFPHLFFQQVNTQRDRIALRRKEFGIWNRITWDEYGKRVRQTAAGLIHAGLQAGDRVAILGDNRPEWLVCHLATMAIGCVTCGVYSTNAAEQVAYVVGHSESKLLFVENEEQVDKVLQIYPDLEQLQQVVVWDPKGLWGFTHKGIMYYDEFLEQGDAYLRDYPTCVTGRMDAIDPQDTAMMIYTSGTTGRPKGAMISHNNILGLTESFTRTVAFRADDELLSYLPLAHIYENLLSVFQAIYSGGTVNFVESMNTLPLNLRELSPTIFASVPRIWEKFMSTIEIRMSDSTLVKRVFYRLAVRVGLRYVRTDKNSGQRILWGLLAALFSGALPPEAAAGTGTGALWRLRRRPGLTGAIRVLQCPGGPATGGIRPNGIHRRHRDSRD